VDPIIEAGRKAMKAAGGRNAQGHDPRRLHLMTVARKCPHSGCYSCTLRRCALGKGKDGLVSISDCLTCIGTDASVAWELVPIEAAIVKGRAKKRAQDDR